MKNCVLIASLSLLIDLSISQNITQVHIAYGRDPARSLTVSWVSNISDHTLVGYGKASSFDSAPLEISQFEFFATPSDIFKYSLEQNPYGFPTIWGPNWSDPTFKSTFANYTSDFIHNTSIYDLEPDTLYYYQIGSSELFNFTTGVIPGAYPSDGAGGHKPLKLTITGDLGQTADSYLTLGHMLEDVDASFAVIVGDVSYSDCDGTRWDSSLDMLQPLAAWKQLMVGPGNHEIEYFPNTDMSFQGFEYRFFMPGVGPAEGLKGGAHFSEDDGDGFPYCTPSEYVGSYNYGNSFYSIDVGPLHFISLNCYTQSDYDSPQYKWLVDDFSSLNRSLTPFIVVIGHCPYYSTNSHHFQEWQTLKQQSYFEALFLENSVNLVLAGHVHAYQRTHPVYNNEVVDEGPVYIVIGDGGNREGHAKAYEKPDPAWSAYKNDTSFGHGTIAIANDTHMLWEWFINNESREWYSHDSAWLKAYSHTPLVETPTSTPSSFPSSQADNDDAMAADDDKINDVDDNGNDDKNLEENGSAQIAFSVMLMIIVMLLFYCMVKCGLVCHRENSSTSSIMGASSTINTTPGGISRVKKGDVEIGKYASLPPISSDINAAVDNEDLKLSYERSGSDDDDSGGNSEEGVFSGLHVAYKSNV